MEPGHQGFQRGVFLCAPVEWGPTVAHRIRSSQAPAYGLYDVPVAPHKTLQRIRWPRSAWSFTRHCLALVCIPFSALLGRSGRPITRKFVIFSAAERQASQWRCVESRRGSLGPRRTRAVFCACWNETVLVIDVSAQWTRETFTIAPKTIRTTTALWVPRQRAHPMEEIRTRQCESLAAAWRPDISARLA